MNSIKIFLILLMGIMLTFFIGWSWRELLVEREWKQFETEHFVISSQGVYENEAEDIGKVLEENYNRIRDDLKDPDHSVVHVFIYSTQKDFNQGTGLKDSNANGTSRGPFEFHILWTNWFNSILPDDPLKTALHEFTHCVQLNILVQEEKDRKSWNSGEDFESTFERKFEKEYPQWFWEAICLYEAGEVNSWSVKYAMRSHPSLNYLNQSNQIYNVGYTLIEYIVRTWGKDKLPELIRSFVDLRIILKVDQADFEQGWYDFVKEKYGI